jgi:hypothetical protein
VKMGWLRGANWAKVALARDESKSNAYPSIDPNWQRLQQGNVIADCSLVSHIPQTDKEKPWNIFCVIVPNIKD